MREHYLLTCSSLDFPEFNSQTANFRAIEKRILDGIIGEKYDSRIRPSGANFTATGQGERQFHLSLHPSLPLFSLQSCCYSFCLFVQLRSVPLCHFPRINIRRRRKRQNSTTRVLSKKRNEYTLIKDVMISYKTWWNFSFVYLMNEKSGRKSGRKKKNLPSLLALADWKNKEWWKVNQERNEGQEERWLGMWGSKNDGERRKEFRVTISHNFLPSDMVKSYSLTRRQTNRQLIDFITFFSLPHMKMSSSPSPHFVRY